MTVETGERLLAVRDLRVRFSTGAGAGAGDVGAVDGLSFELDRGEVLAVVGESGSGKSTMALSLLGLVPGPSGRSDSGQVVWKGRDLVPLPEAELRRVRGSEMAMIFQDPSGSLNPVQPVGRQIAETVRLHRGASRKEARERAVEMLDMVGIAQARRRARSYPHELSGGMRQRVMIAMALAGEPELVIADEPTSGLDVTVQAEVLDVLREARERTGVALLLISHDLGVVAGMADRVLVMYAGRAVEQGIAADVFHRPRHPYTLGLLRSHPWPGPGEAPARLLPIEGRSPSLVEVPPGCSFHPRCPFAGLPEPCATEMPPLAAVPSQTGHAVACHYADEVAVAAAREPEAAAAEPGAAAGEGDPPSSRSLSR